MTRAPLPRLLLALLLLSAIVAGAGAYTIDGYTFAAGQEHAIPGTGSTVPYHLLNFTLSNATGDSTGNVIYTDGTTAGDWRDIRFTDGSNALLPYWVEPTSLTATTALVWVNMTVPAGGTTIRLYCDSDTAPSASNGSATWRLFDDFSSGSVDTAKWTDAGGTSISNGILTVTGASTSYRGITSTATYGSGTAIRGRVAMPSSNYGSPRGHFGYWYLPGTGYPAGAWYQSVYGASSDLSITQNGASESATTTYELGDSYHTLDVIRNDTTSAIFKADGAVTATHTTYLPASASGVYVQTFDGPVGLSLDWVALRNYTAVEPEHGSYTDLVLPTAAFTANATTGDAPLTVQFNDTSTGAPTSWSWDIDGDGVADSTDQNPVVEYANAGTYTINLTVANTAGNDTDSKTNYITVTDAALAPVADFSANVTSGIAPLLVGFTSTSTNATDWSWDFDGDGGADGGGESVIYIYANPGLYTVVLNASGQGGFDTETKIDYITVTAPGVVTPPPTTVAPTGFTALSETHGTTWIRWTWSPAVNLSANQTLVGVYDGLEVFNVTSNATIPPEMYYRGDLNPNEYHLFGLVLVNATDGNQTTTSIDLGVTTAQGAEFFYIIFVVALALALVGAIIPNRYMALVLLMFAFLLSAYLAIGTTASNASFSVIAVMMVVVTALGMIFVVYDLVKSHVSWENDDY